MNDLPEDHRRRIIAVLTDWATLLAAIPLGFAIGIVVGTVGGGGAILALPVFVYVLDQPIGPATTASLIVVALGASFGAGSQARDGRLCGRVAAWFATPAVIGAYLGTVAGLTVDPRLLILCFIPVMFAASVLTFRRASVDGTGPTGTCPTVAPVRTAAAGLGVGVMTGFFGVGGGFLIVPALTSVLGLSMKRAVATSLLIITITGLAALASHLLESSPPDWGLAGTIAIATAAGALAGSAIGRRVSGRWLSLAFSAVVAVIALLLLIDVLFLGGPPA